MEPAQGRISFATKKILSRHNIQSSQQRVIGLCSDKDYFCRNKQNMREVNSLSRQEVEEQYKRNGDKEIHVTT